MPIRARLAGTSALLTLVILCGFAVAVGQLTISRIRSDFNRQVHSAANDLVSGRLRVAYVSGSLRVYPQLKDLDLNHAVIRILAEDGRPLATTARAPNLSPAGVSGVPVAIPRTANVDGYRVETQPLELIGGGQAYIQYARPLSEVDATVSRVRLLLILGVLGGTGLALLTGLMIARRAMAPIARLTATAQDIARTRDPRRSVPRLRARDEVGELARTLDEMLRSLDSARRETEATLALQRQFVADASHELRTPLTSVLANLELLAETLHGDQGDAARAALRSSQRMRRLVADLLLLARSDVGREASHEPTDLAEVVVDAASELGPVSEEHEIELDAQPAFVDGAPDDLLRLAINLIENAIRHTPPGTHVRVHTGPGPVDGAVQLAVEDDGPGVPDELAPRLFERFVRGDGDRGGSFGLGLAIVRAVAESHGGNVALERPSSSSGARFVVTLPGIAVPGRRSQRRAQLVR